MMRTQHRSGVRRVGQRLAMVGMGLLLAACASGPDRPQPAELSPNAALISVRLAWSSRIGAVHFPLDVGVAGTTVTVAGSDGSVAAIDSGNGADQWRVSVGADIGGGVGSDGRYAAVVTRGNYLVALERGREIWRENLGALSFTAPLVAGERIFVMTADRVVSAFDARSGRRLWGRQPAVA